MKWFNIGIQLGTSVSALDVIHVSEQGDPDNCITAMIKNWLRSVDIQPTWAALARALRSPTVGCGHLAEQLDTQKGRLVLHAGLCLCVCGGGLISWLWINLLICEKICD